MGKLVDLFERLRKRSLERGYGCDVCDAELFNYPARRLCEACESQLRPITRACEVCGRSTRAEGICLSCKATRPKFTKGISAFDYVGFAASLVNRMKEGNPRLASYFGEKMTERLLKEKGDLGEVLILPVPSSEKKLRIRGYNPAERLAERVQICLEKEGVTAILDTEVLEKTRETLPQKDVLGRERAKNVEGAYFVKKRKACKNKTVLLVDDVMTTGATGSEVADRILRAGASKVYFMTATAVVERK